MSRTAGLIDDIHVNVIPILLGGGARLCEGLITPPIELERMSVAASSSRRTWRIASASSPVLGAPA